MSLTCAIDFREEFAVIKPSGEVDLTTTTLLRDAVEAVIDRPGITWIDVDLADVTFLDSTGIAVLVATHNAASAKGISMRVLRPHPIVRTLLEVVGLLDLMIASAGIPEQRMAKPAMLPAGSALDVSF